MKYLEHVSLIFGFHSTLICNKRTKQQMTSLVDCRYLASMKSPWMSCPLYIISPKKGHLSLLKVHITTSIDAFPFMNLTHWRQFRQYNVLLIACIIIVYNLNQGSWRLFQERKSQNCNSFNKVKNNDLSLYTTWAPTKIFLFLRYNLILCSAYVEGATDFSVVKVSGTNS